MEPELEEGQGETEEINSQGAPAETSPAEGTGINPAWSELLDVLPSQLQPLVTPHLTKWDKNYQEGIQKVHSEYEAFKPFKEGNIDPEQINYGLELLQAIQERPQEIFEALKEHFEAENPTTPQAQEELTDEEQGQTPSIDLSQYPEFKEMQEALQAMATLTVQQRQEVEQAQQDSELEQEFAAAKEKHGEFDEKWVITQMLANEGMTLDQAAESYNEFVKSILTSHNKPGPKVMGTGGQSASTTPNPSELDDKGRRSMVAQMLADAQSNNG